MKKVRKDRWVPSRLYSYAKRNPCDTWGQFHHRDRKGYRQVKEQLLKDQHGLCAYCEISIKLAEEEDQVDDFRVEHFFPKSETDMESHNYHLDWRNMLGVCHGGSQPHVAEANIRYSAKKWDRSCDVPKGGKAITHKILNPLHIPAEIRLFKYDSFTGEMFVDKETCPERLRKKAKNTLRELNLNAPRLMRLRKAAVEVLEDQVEEGVRHGLEMEEILSMLAEGLLVPDEDGAYPNFFTVIRWYLGEEGERVLAERNYDI